MSERKKPDPKGYYAYTKLKGEELVKEYSKKLNINYEIENYPGTGHGFVFPQRLGLYNKQAAEKHWNRLLKLFDRNLLDVQ